MPFVLTVGGVEYLAYTLPKSQTPQPEWSIFGREVFVRDTGDPSKNREIASRAVRCVFRDTKSLR